MPISINSTGLSAQGTATASLNWNLTVADGINRALFISVGGIGAALSTTTGVSTVTYGSQSLTLVTKIQNTGVGTDLINEVWYLRQPSGGIQTCTVTMNNAFDVIRAYAFCLNGVAQVSGTTIENTAVFQVAGVTITGQVTSVNANSWILNSLTTKGDANSGVSGQFVDTGTVSGGATGWTIEVDNVIKATSTTALNGSLSFAWKGPVSSQVLTGTWSGTAGDKVAMSMISVKANNSDSKPSGSRNFNGFNSWIRCGPATVMTRLGQLFDSPGGSLGCWFYARTTGDAGTGALLASLANQGYQIRFSAGKILFSVTTSGTTVSRLSSTVVTLNAWNFVLVTWDGTTTDATTIHIYLNGVETGYTSTTNGTGTVTSDQAFFIGHVNTGNNFGFDGYICHVQAFNRILSRPEIQQVMWMPGSIRNNLQGYWPLNGTADTEPDLTGNTLNATVTNCYPGPGAPIGRNSRQKRRIFETLRTSPLVLTETGSISGSRNFNGTTDKLTILTSTQTKISISAWVLLDAAGNSDYPRILDMPGYQFYFGKDTTAPLSGDDNTLKFGSLRTPVGTDGVWNTPQGSHTNGTWVNCAVTYDSASTSNVPFMWLNGVFQTVSTQTPPLLTQDDNAGSGYIGNNLAGNRALDGKIAHLQVWNRLLTDGEIKQSMWLPGSLRDGLLAYYPMFGDASPESDLSGNKNNATVTGTFKFNGPPIVRNARLSRRRFTQNQNLQAVAYLVNLSLAMSVANNLAKDTLKGIVQAIALTESKSIDTLKAIAQAITLTSSLSKDYLKAISQALSLSESKSLDTLKAFTQAIAVTNTQSKDVLKAVSEAITVNNSISKDTLKQFADTFILTEGNSKDILKQISQSITLSESQAKDITKAIALNLNVTESQAKDLLKALAVTMNLTESQFMSFFVITGILLTFIQHGMVETHDKISMERDLTSTGVSKLENDTEQNELVSTGTLKKDTQDMEIDSDRITWDFHNE